MTAKSEEKSHYQKLIGLLLVFASMLAIVALYALDITFLYEPKYLLGVTNTIFTAIIPLVVAFFAARTYLRTGSSSVLLMGCGMLGFGLCAASAGWLIELQGGANFNVTIYNTGALLGSLCHFAGAIINSSRKSYRREPGWQKLTVVPAYSAILMFAVLFSFAAVQHVVPPFFIQGSGPTAVRQIVLGLAIFLYATSCLLFMNNYLRIKSDFFYWYSLCLAMLALGLFAFYIQRIVGSPIGWVGRTSNYLGTIFSLIAILAAVRSGKSSGLPLEEIISGFFVDAEANYRSLVETASNAIISFDQENRIILWNSGAEQIFGYSKPEAIGSPVFGMLIAEEHENTLAELIEASQGMSSQKTVEIVAKHKNGGLFPIEISAFRRKLPNGRVSTCILRDITERRQMEDELRKSRDELELRVQERARELLATNQALQEKAELIDLAHDAILVRDTESRIVFWSRGARETYGFTREEALGQISHELLKTVFPMPYEKITQTLLEKGEWKGELKHTTANGERVVVDSIQVRRDGEPAGFLEVNRDITTREIAQERFRKADRAFRTLSECNQATVRQTEEMELLRQVCRIVVDVGGYRMAWVGFAENDENKTVLPIATAGYDQGYLDQAGITWADTESGRGPTGTAIRTGKIIISQNALSNPAYQPWRSEGTRRGYASSIALPLIVERNVIGALTIYASEPDAFDEGEASLLSNTAENLAYGIGSIRVADQRRRSEEELRLYASRLEIINKELQDFAFVASHDLQEPLRKIQTFCDMAKKRCAPALDATGQDYLDRVINSANRMRHLLRDLLEFSRMAARPELFKKIDLAALAREAADVFEAKVKETGCRIEIENIPVIEADGSQMLSLFQNLIGNALKFRSREAPLVRIYSRFDRQGICEIFVKDNGIGFDQQFAELIFKPFQRLHGQGEYHGTGMGLAICRKIVERHGGTIRAESEPGKGSTFIIRLPVIQPRLEAVIAGKQP